MPRDALTRKSDTLAMWATPEIDVWVSTASAAAEAHLVLRPERVQAWRESDEIAGRTIMRDGAWLV
jgi:hypothetical protein